MKDIDVTFLNQIREELQEERQHQQADMHTVHICIGRDNDFVVPQFIEAVFDIQGRLQAVELLVLIDDGFGQSVRVQRFTAQREHRLCTHVTGLSNRTGSRQTLRDKDTTVLTKIIICIFCRFHRLSIVVMDLTIAQFRIVQQVLFRTLTSRFGHTGNCLTLLLRILNLLQHHVRYLGMFVQVIVKLGLNEIVDELINGYIAVRRHVFRTEFDFRLRLKYRLFDIDSYRTNDTVTDVRQFLVLVIELFYRTTDSLAESRLMRTALNGILAVDERIILVSRLIRMRESNLYILSGNVDNRIQRLSRHTLGQQVEEAVLGHKLLTVIDQSQTGIEVCIVAQHRLDVFIAEGVVVEQFLVVIRRKLDESASLRFGFLTGTFHPLGDRHNIRIFDQFALMEHRPAGTVITERLYGEIEGKCIYRLRTDTVQTDGFMERLIIIFPAGIDDRNGIHELTQRNTATVVTHGNLASLYRHFNHLTFAHAELVN